MDPAGGGGAPAGVPGSAQGREEMAEVLVEILEVFDRFELALVVFVDLGNSLIVLGRSRVHGRGSGVELQTEVAQVLTIERGLVARERDFFSWDDALRAAALDPAGLALPCPH
jgi:hypothetical protein